MGGRVGVGGVLGGSCEIERFGGGLVGGVGRLSFFLCLYPWHFTCDSFWGRGGWRCGGLAPALADHANFEAATQAFANASQTALTLSPLTIPT